MKRGYFKDTITYQVCQYHLCRTLSYKLFYVFRNSENNFVHQVNGYLNAFLPVAAKFLFLTTIELAKLIIIS